MVHSVLFLIGKIIVGLYFVNAGFNHFRNLERVSDYAASKGIPASKFSTIISGLFLLFGGLSFLLGAYQLIGSILLIVFLLPAAFFIHNFWILPKEQRMNDMLNFMRNIVYIGFILMLLSVPVPWAFSI